MHFLSDRWAFVAILLVCFLPFCSGQNVHFFLKPNWTKGETRHFELTKGKHIRDGKDLKEKTETRQILTLTVLDKTPRAYLLSAKYQDATATQTENTKPLEVRYWIPESGDFQQIINFPEIQSALKPTLDSLVAAAAATPSVARTIGELRRHMTSESYLTQAFFQELPLLHQYYGNTFTVDSLENYMTELPNLLNPMEAPILAKASLMAKTDNLGYAYIRHIIEPDLKIIQRLSEQYKDRMSAGSSRAINSQSAVIGAAGQNGKSFDLSIRDENLIAFDLETGWLEAFQRQRKVLENTLNTLEFVTLKVLRK
jgi:hypothetical protein